MSRLQEQVSRIRKMMGLLNEQGTAPLGSTEVKSSSLGDWFIDTFIPGEPLEKGRDILNTFARLSKKRMEYNKQHGLPLEKLTPEEIAYREKIFKATPSFKYPEKISEFNKIIDDIAAGKDIGPEDYENYKNPKSTIDGDFLAPKGSVKIDNYDAWKEDLWKGRQELKRRWLGIHTPSGKNDEYWVKSEFSPGNQTNSNVEYLRPSVLPKFNQQEFDELYNAIMNTRKSDGKFPGGNSSTIKTQAFEEKFKHLNVGKLRQFDGLGNFKFGAGEDNGKKWISVYDLWDLFPPRAKEWGYDIQQYGNSPEIYYRIYRP